MAETGRAAGDAAFGLIESMGMENRGTRIVFIIDTEGRRHAVLALAVVDVVGVTDALTQVRLVNGDVIEVAQPMTKVLSKVGAMRAFAHMQDQ